MKEELKIIEEKTIPLNDNKTTIHIVKIKNKYFKGISKFNSEDEGKIKFSYLIGGTIAKSRAMLKYYNYCLKHGKLDSTDFNTIKQLKEDLLVYLDTIIDDYYQQQQRIKQYKERKANNLPDWKEQLQQQVSDLLKLKENIIK